MDVKPMCPYCGTMMILERGHKIGLSYACPNCWSESPFIKYKGGEDTLALCYESALHRLMQKPLELAQLEALIAAGEDVAVYCEAKNDPHAYATILFAGQVISPNDDKINACDLVYFHYGKTWRAWAQRPTDEERAAAPWEDKHE